MTPILKYAAIGLFVLGVLVATYRAGGAAPRAELQALKALGAQQAKQVKKTEAKQKEVAQHADKKASDVYRRIDDAYRLRHNDPHTMPGAAAFAPALVTATETGASDTQGCTERDSAADAAQVMLLQAFYEQQRELINGHARTTE